VGYRTTMPMAEEGLFSQIAKHHEDNLFDVSWSQFPSATRTPPLPEIMSSEASGLGL
jgi:hypothetical protein